VNNLFFQKRFVLYYWVEEHHSRSVTGGRQQYCLVSAAVSIWNSDLSRGLYLLFSTAAMQAFDKKQKCVWVALAL